MKLRLTIFVMINSIFILIWMIYLFIVQIMDPHDFKNVINRRQHLSKQIITSYRGNIYDRNKQLLVSSIKLYQIDIDRNAISKYCKKNAVKGIKIADVYQEIAKIISKYTAISRKSVLLKLNTNLKANAVFIVKNITENDIENIKAKFGEENIPGLVKSFSGIRRTYPKNKLAARLLGMVKSSEKNRETIYDVRGKCGLESTFDTELSGKYGWKEVFSDANNRKIPFLFLKENKPQNGNSIILTIDANLQEIMENNLTHGIEKYKAKNAIGVIMNPQTGEILAMAGLSKEDNFKSPGSLRALPNLAVSFMFEPGSTLKPITALIALEKDIYKPEQKIDCRDYQMENRLIKDVHEYRYLSFKDIIAHSSNVGVSKIVEKIGSKMLYDRMVELGFGHRTGSNLAGESDGIFRKLKDWQGFSLHSISFGQEISVTAIQLANAYCTFANGGNVMKPYICSEIIDENGKRVKKFKPKKLRTISDKKSVDTLKDFLKGVVDYGTGVATKFDQLTVAGKTGTAEKSKSGTAGYSKDKYTSVFAGFFPVEDPKYVMVVAFDEPDFYQYYHYAAQSAVPTFKNIIKNMINLPQNNLLSEAKEKDIEFVKMPKLIGLTKEKTLLKLSKAGINYKIINNSDKNIVADQYPKPQVKFNKNETVIIIFDKKENIVQNDSIDYKMPNLVGLTLKNAISVSNRKKIKLIVQGNGIINTQSIPAGSKIKFGERCNISATR
ncbi:MAG: PASTA domain-containing protein [Candidatus Cloacimonetes bacterium]|nr:PASTA domain-containing protein [Candidatus Cloacimonadota bacterium]